MMGSISILNVSPRLMIDYAECSFSSPPCPIVAMDINTMVNIPNTNA